MYYTKKGTPVKVGVKGQADIYGYINGYAVEIEIKTGKGKQSKEQKNWQKLCEKINIPYFVIRSIEDLDLISPQLFE